MNVEELIAKATEPLVEHFKENDIAPYRDDRVTEYINGTILGNVTRLRLDWEFLVEGEDNQEWLNTGSMAEQMLKFMTNDLVHLIQEGDMSNYDNTLLSSLNGEAVRGVPVLDVNILSAELFREYKPKKKTVEFTMFILLHTVWE